MVVFLRVNIAGDVVSRDKRTFKCLRARRWSVRFDFSLRCRCPNTLFSNKCAANSIELMDGIVLYVASGPRTHTVSISNSDSIKLADKNGIRCVNTKKLECDK